MRTPRGVQTGWCIALGKTIENTEGQRVSDVFYCLWMVRSLRLDGPPPTQDLDSRISSLQLLSFPLENQAHIWMLSFKTHLEDKLMVSPLTDRASWDYNPNLTVLRGSVGFTTSLQRLATSCSSPASGPKKGWKCIFKGGRPPTFNFLKLRKALNLDVTLQGYAVLMWSDTTWRTGTTFTFALSFGILQK